MKPTVPSSPAAATGRFREADLLDAPALADLVNSAYRGPRSHAGWTTEAHLIEGQRTETNQVHLLMAERGVAFLVYEEPPMLVGSLQVTVGASGTAEIGMFAIQPERQAHGLGRALLAYAEHYARVECACRTVTLAVLSVRPELLSWYERRGYQRNGTTKDFPYGQAHLGTPRRPDLRLCILTKSLD